MIKPQRYCTEALKAFYDRGWEYDDFPEEPLPMDGTISHAIERLRPFAAQQAGYYTAFVMSDHFSRIEYTNLRTYVEDFHRVFFDRNIYEPHYGLVDEMRRRLS
ncbi:MAG: rhamnan synthesis F family protein [Lachnospiraceae bacterium]|nr:rhamnan synthesis F family protein [Lachnospiraceae bacterium]